MPVDIHNKLEFHLTFDRCGVEKLNILQVWKGFLAVIIFFYRFNTKVIIFVFLVLSVWSRGY